MKIKVADNVILFGFYLFFILVLILLGGCYTAKKASDQVDKAILKYPDVAATELRKAFPCKVVNKDTIYTLGDTTIEVNCPETYISDTVYNHTHDTIVSIEYKNKTVKVPVTLPVKTVTIVQQVKDETCEPIIKGLQDKVAQLTTDKEHYIGKFNMWKWIAIGLMCLIGLYIILWIVYKVKSFGR